MAARYVAIGALLLAGALIIKHFMAKKLISSGHSRPHHLPRPRRVPHKVYADPQGNIHHMYKDGLYLGKRKASHRRWEYQQLDGSIMPHFSEDTNPPEIV